MKIPSLFWFEMEPANDWRSYFAYAIYRPDVPPTHPPIYIGYCDARELLTGMNPRKNSAWMKLMSEEPLLKFHVQVIGKFNTVDEARTVAHQWAYAIRPTLNMSGVERQRKKRVRCMNNGMEFSTVTEAARWIECTQPHMSAHLGRYPGYNTIKGHTFERID